MTANDSSDRREVPDWMLERYALGELPVQEMDELRTALEIDAGLRQRLAALEADSAARLAAHPSRMVGASIRRRFSAARERPHPWRPALAFATPVLAAVVAVGLWLDHSSVPLPPAVEPDTTRVKGPGPRLLLYRRAGDVAETLASGQSARRGDVVQLAYHGAGARFGAIVSVDGRGVVTSHLPAGGALAASLEPDGAVLETAYKLDDAPRFEVFYFVTAGEAFDLAALRSAALVAATSSANPPLRLSLPASFGQTAFVLRKDLQK